MIAPQFKKIEFQTKVRKLDICFWYPLMILCYHRSKSFFKVRTGIQFRKLTRLKFRFWIYLVDKIFLYVLMYVHVGQQIY